MMSVDEFFEAEANLKKCPFCGGDAEIVIRTYRKGLFKKQGIFYVRCEICKATSAAEFNDKTVCNAWNRRAGDMD